MIQVTIFKYAIYQFQTILINCVPNDFLQQGYTSYGSPPQFPRLTTPGDPSTPCVESSQVNLYFAFKSESRLLNMTRSLLCCRVLRVARHPRCHGEDLPWLVHLPRGSHRLWPNASHLQVHASSVLPNSHIQVSHPALLPHSRVRVTGRHRHHGELHLEARHHRPLECLRGWDRIDLLTSHP
jgi:hypothetical protein